MEILTPESYEELRCKQRKPMIYAAICVLGMFVFGGVTVYLERNPLANFTIIPAVICLICAIVFVIYGFRLMLIAEESIVISDKVYLFGTQYRLKQEEGFTDPKISYAGHNNRYQPRGARFVFTKSNVLSAITENVPTPYNFFDARLCLAGTEPIAVHIKFKTPLRNLSGGEALTDFFVSVPDASKFISMLK